MKNNIYKWKKWIKEKIENKFSKVKINKLTLLKIEKGQYKILFNGLYKGKKIYTDAKEDSIQEVTSVIQKRLERQIRSKKSKIKKNRVIGRRDIDLAS